MDWMRAVEGGVEVFVLVQPRASRTKVVGVHDGRLKVALAAPPVDGAANQALVEFFAEVLGVKQKAVVLVDGHSGRRKRLRIDGLDVDRAGALLR